MTGQSTMEATAVGKDGAELLDPVGMAPAPIPLAKIDLRDAHAIRRELLAECPHLSVDGRSGGLSCSPDWP
jgi:hypothetical protein